jgi:hypothetical protein
MRRTLAIALLLAGTVAGPIVGLASSPAAAGNCIAHSRTHYVSDVQYRRISCDRATYVIRHALRKDAKAIGWSCERTYLGGNTQHTTCRSVANPSRRLVFDARLRG